MTTGEKIINWWEKEHRFLENDKISKKYSIELMAKNK
jgi:hypothetical protein